MREILVRDLGRCIQCETCVNACQARHGRARMTMTGQRFGQYQLPDICRHCQDPACVRACYLGGMRREHGKTIVSDACRGCKKCAEACPNGSIEIVLRPEQHGLLLDLFSQILGTGERTPNYRILTDRVRCVQCGICSHNCPAGIDIREQARRGLTVQDPRCVGCGLCVAKCPRGTLRFETYPVLPTPAFRADKCDLCRGYRESACVGECPTGAMARLRVDERLATLNTNLYEALVSSEPDQNDPNPLSTADFPCPVTISSSVMAPQE